MKISFTRTIRSRLMLLTAITTLLIAVSTVSTFYVIFQSLFRRNQLQAAQFNLETVSNDVSSKLNDIIYFTNWCCSNATVSRYLENFRDKPKLATAAKENPNLRNQALTSVLRLQEEYNNTNYSDNIERTIISTENKLNYLQIVRVAANSTSNAAGRAADMPFFQELFDAPDYKWIGLTQSLTPGVSCENIIPIVRPIRGEYGVDQLGWVYTEISPNLLLNSIKAFPLTEGSFLYLTIGSKMYSFHSQDTGLEAFTPDYEIIRPMADDYLQPGTSCYEIRTADGNKHLLISRSLGVEGWEIAQLLSHQDLNAQRGVYYLLLIGSILLILALGFAMAYLLHKIINQPIQKITNKISAISQGDFSRDNSIEWEHELGEIGKGINLLSENVVALMDTRVENERQKRDLEYQILQSQINPHFLYNTLNSIKWMATIQGSEGIAKMITSLSRLLKNVAKGSTAPIPLREELDLMRDYILIQEYRYGGGILVTYDIRHEDLLNCLVHRFTLQPIIENALFHGIEPKGGSGKIQITVKRDVHKGLPAVRISVWDDGVGMTEEVITHVMTDSSSTGNDFFRKVGISNVHKRIQFDFGPDYGLSIQSKPGEYTQVDILIPCTRKEGDND